MTIEDYENISAALCDRTNNTIKNTLNSLWNLLSNFRLRNQNIDISTEIIFTRESFSKIEGIIKPPENRRENMKMLTKLHYLQQ